MKITYGQLKKLAKTHKFLLLRDEDGHLYGLNTASIFKGRNTHHSDNSLLYGFGSWIPCSIAEYITYKMPYKS